MPIAISMMAKNRGCFQLPPYRLSENRGFWFQAGPRLFFNLGNATIPRNEIERERRLEPKMRPLDRLLIFRVEVIDDITLIKRIAAPE